MKLLIDRFRWVGIVLGIMLILAGATVIAISIAIATGAMKGDSLTIVLSITAAVICFLLGAIYLGIGLSTPLSKFFDSSFVLAAVCIAAGAVLLIVRDQVPTLLTYLIAVALIAFGGIYLIRAILYCVYKGGLVKIIGGFVIATLTIAAGILALIFKDKLYIAINIVIGVIAMAVGIVVIILTTKKKN